MAEGENEAAPDGEPNQEEIKQEDEGDRRLAAVIQDALDFVEASENAQANLSSAPPSVRYATFPTTLPPEELRVQPNGKKEFWKLYMKAEGDLYQNLCFCLACEKVGNVNWFKCHRKHGFNSLEAHWKSHNETERKSVKPEGLHTFGFNPSKVHKDEILSGHAMFVALDFRPINTIQGEGFLHLMKSINKQYIPFSRETVTSRISTIAKERRTLLFSEMKQHDSIAITYDCWRDQSKKDWLGVTSHFIDKNWNMHQVILDVKHLTDRHTAEKISSMIREIFNQGDLDINRLLACVTDNASNMISSVRKIRDVNCVDRVPRVAHT